VVKFYEGGVSFTDLNNMPLPDLFRLMDSAGVQAKRIKSETQQAMRRGNGF